MKTDELLYEMMQDMSDKEADELEKELNDLQPNQESITKERFDKQKNLTMDKIYAEMKKEEPEEKQGDSSIHFGRKRLVLLIAAAVMMLGIVAFAKEKDWDIEMAEMLGLSGVMEELDGGYAKIGVSDTADDVTITASQLIGDKNSMWLQLDTDVPWTVEDGGYYLFENNRMDCYYHSDRPLTGGQTWYSFNNNGYISFIWQFEDYDNINRSTIKIWIDKIVEYQPIEKEEDEEISTIISDGTWELEWENYYAPNTITRYPFKKVACKAGDEELECVIREVEVSPISIQIKGWKSPYVDVESDFIILEAVKLKDGTVIECEECIGGKSNFEVSGYLSLDYAPEIDMSEIEYVTIGGEDIRIAR